MFYFSDKVVADLFTAVEFRLNFMDYLNKLRKSKTILSKLLFSLYIFSQSILNRVSINKLTLLGFTFVAMPLVMALLFSANKVSLLAKQSTSAIYHVAQLTQLNSRLEDTIAKVERYASQFIVLKDDELHTAFNRHQEVLADIIQATVLMQQDIVLKELLSSLQIESERIQALMASDSAMSLSLDQVQAEFKQLHFISKELEKRSNFVVNQQVLDIYHTTENISDSILERLYIIPVTLLIAGIFIILITQPLKRLTDKIQLLEQGNFEQEINLHGPAEVRAIADALENMRQRLHSL